MNTPTWLVVCLAALGASLFWIRKTLSKLNRLENKEMLDDIKSESKKKVRDMSIDDLIRDSNERRRKRHSENH